MTTSADDRVADLGKTGNTRVAPYNRILYDRFLFNVNTRAKNRIQNSCTRFYYAAFAEDGNAVYRGRSRDIGPG